MSGARVSVGTDVVFGLSRGRASMDLRGREDAHGGSNDDGDRACDIACGAGHGRAGWALEPALSAAETAAVNRSIATLRSESDRKAAAEWSNSKKVAEMLCRPAATAYWKKKAPGTDRVFLGTSAPETLALESDRRLTGSGQYRTAKGWTDFRFTCGLDPEKGRVTSFETTSAPGNP